MASGIHEPGPWCGTRRDEIIDYVFEEMGPGAAEAFESHLASCPGCAGEAALLRGMVELIEEASPASAGAEASANGGSGSSVSLEEEWALLRRRLRFPEALSQETEPSPHLAWARTWLPAAAAVAVTALLSFAAGWLWRGEAPGAEVASANESQADIAERPALPPVTGASVGNYFDHLEDFTRDTHNCLRRTRMILMEFTKLGADSDPTFFRQAAGDLRAEVERYRQVALRLESRKLGDLLDQISGILKAISTINPENQVQVIADVRMTLELTAILSALEILDAHVERTLEGPPNV